MSTSALIVPSRLRALAGTAARIVLLGALAIAGAVAAVAALALGAAVTGGLFVWSKVSARGMRTPRSSIH